MMKEILERITEHIQKLQMGYTLVQQEILGLKGDRELMEKMADVEKLADTLSDNQKKIKIMEKQYEALIELEKKIITDNDKMTKRMESVLGVIEVAVDVHEYHPKSWAVICVDGKSSYVKLVDLNAKDAKEIMHFIKNFEYNSAIIDAHPRFVRYMRGE